MCKRALLGRCAAAYGTSVLLLGILSSQAQGQSVTQWRGGPSPFGTPAEWGRRQDSLERVAVGATDQGERLLATLRIAGPGRSYRLEDEPPDEVVYPGIVAALKRIYVRSEGQIRAEIVGMLPGQGERSDALQFLAELARTNDRYRSGAHSIGEYAVVQLSRMGPAGAAELQRLHASGEGNELVRKLLDRLAQTGYRKPPGG